MPSGRRKRQPRTTAATVTTESGVERPAASQPVRSVSDPASVPVAAPVVQRPVIPAVDPAAAQAAGFSAEMLQSLGPWEEMMTMPDLRGREMVTALNLLRELQVEARVSFEASASRQGVVVAQDPPPGGKVRVGAQVQITVGE